MAGLSKLHRTCPWEYFQEKHLFWKNSSNFTNPGHWLKGFWHFLKYFWAASGNCILRAHKNFLMENSFLVTFKFFDLCCIMSQLFLGTLSRLSRQGCENCIRRVQRSYSYGKIYFRLKKNFLVLQIRSRKNFGRLSKSFRRGCKSCSVGDHCNILITDTFFRKKLDFFFISFVHCAKNFRPIVAKTLVGLSKLHSTCLEEHFSNFFGKILIFLSFSVFERPFFGIKLKSFRRGCENCTLWVHTDILKANTFFGNNKNF